MYMYNVKGSMIKLKKKTQLHCTYNNTAVKENSKHLF